MKTTIVDFFDLNEMIVELQRYHPIIRLQSLQPLVPVEYGTDKNRVQVMHRAYEVHVTARIKDELWSYVERVALIDDNDDKRRHTNAKKKTEKLEANFRQRFENAGFPSKLIEKGRYRCTK